MSKAPGLVKDYDGSGDWFKVHQIGTTGTFGGPTWDGKDDGWLALNQNQFTFKLPAEIPAGQYLLRIEHMAVHPPYRAKQFFFQVSNLFPSLLTFDSHSLIVLQFCLSPKDIVPL